MRGLIGYLSETTLSDFVKFGDYLECETGSSKVNCIGVVENVNGIGDGSRIYDNVGYACCKGLKPESPNKDSWLFIQYNPRCSLYGVFDGHGKHGHLVSNYVKENL